MSLIERNTLLCLLAVSYFTCVATNSFQELSDFNILNDVIEEETIERLDNNLLAASPKTISSSTDEKSQINPNLFGTKDNEELGMDTVTLIWYLTTFTALLGFFIVMACTENTCNRRSNAKPAERRNATPSPCPSYKHFAPPTYASVMKKFKDPKVFIVPVHEGNNSFFTNPVDIQNQHDAESNEKNEIVVTVSR